MKVIEDSKTSLIIKQQVLGVKFQMHDLLKFETVSNINRRSV